MTSWRCGRARHSDQRQCSATSSALQALAERHSWARYLFRPPILLDQRKTTKKWSYLVKCRFGRSSKQIFALNSIRQKETPVRERFRWQRTVHAIILFELVNQNMKSRIQLDKGSTGCNEGNLQILFTGIYSTFSLRRSLQLLPAKLYTQY